MTKIVGKYYYGKSTSISKSLYAVGFALLLNIFYVTVISVFSDKVDSDIRVAFHMNNLKLVFIENSNIVSNVLNFILLITVGLFIYLITMYFRKKKCYYEVQIKRELKKFIKSTPKTIVYRTEYSGNSSASASQQTSSAFSNFKSNKTIEDTVKIDYEYILESGYLYLRFDTSENSRFFSNDDKSLNIIHFKNHFKGDIVFNEPDHANKKSYYEFRIIIDF